MDQLVVLGIGKYPAKTPVANMPYKQLEEQEIVGLQMQLAPEYSTRLYFYC
jgi:hypothetical protein